MRKYIVILLVIISYNLISQENKISFYNIFTLSFDNKYILDKVGENIFTYQNDENKYMVRFDINITKGKFYTQMNVYLRPIKSITLNDLKKYTKIGNSNNASAMFGCGDEYKYYFIENKYFDILNSNNIIIKRAISDWGNGFRNDILMYNFEIKNNKYFNNCLIEFSSMMPENIKNIEKIKEFINRNDKSVENYISFENTIKSIKFGNGKNIKYYIIRANNVRLRDLPNEDGKIIVNMSMGDKLELLERGKEDEVNYFYGIWIKVKTKDNKIGWCFDYYLKEILF